MREGKSYFVQADGISKAVEIHNKKVDGRGEEDTCKDKN